MAQTGVEFMIGNRENRCNRNSCQRADNNGHDPNVFQDGQGHGDAEATKATNGGQYPRRRLAKNAMAF